METIQSGGVGKPLAVFTGWMILGQGLLAGIGFAFPDLDLPGSFGLVITIVAVLVAGQSFAKASGRVPERGEQARFALGATVIALALAAGSMLAIFAWYGVPVTAETLSLVLTGDVDFAREIGGWLWVILGVSVLITYLLAHFGLKSGAKGYLKKQEKLAARG
jgi:hypothetical protein